MRIGLFSNAYRPVVSGVVNSLAEIRRTLLQRGHTPFLFAPDVKGYRDTHAGVFRFPSVDLDRSVGFPVPIPFSARLSRLIPKMDLELIHSHHPILVGATAAGFARKLHVPLVYTFHTQIEQYTHYVPFFKHETVRDRARRKVSRYLAKCEVVICPSPSIRSLIDSYGVDTRVVTLPNAIDLGKFQDHKARQRELREKLGLSKDALVSLSVGRLAPEKGLRFLLQAFSQTDSSLDHHLVLVGGGPQTEELREMARDLSLQGRVHFLGNVDYSEMPSLYEQADLFVICSTTEVKPLVVLEALASRVPVLAVSACGTQDTLHHREDGWLCNLDQGEYQRGWDTLLHDHELRRALSEGASQTAQSYSIEHYTDRLCQLYSEARQSYAARTCRAG